ncbi:MAG: GNAT family N-acetyltransferase, partial [Nanoarchaeota archaeon]|nr:GNAT family N-acetyltransferase [Nanoarchaeota archaeon]
EIIKKFYLLGRQYPVAVLKLDRPFNDLFRQVFDYQIRKAVNKAIQNKVTVKESNSWDFVEKKFFPLYLKYEKRKHGSPAHSLNFFKQFYLIAPDNFRIFYAEYDNKIIASLFGIFNKSRVQILYNPSLEAFLNLRANDLIHSEFIKWACENGKKYFDFGPVRYEGQKRYKIKWGADLLDWGYYYLSGKKKNIVNVFVDSNFIKIISFVWKNFLPLPMAKILGPYIRKRLGQ